VKNRFAKIVKEFFGWFTGFFGGTFAEVGRSVRHIKSSPLQCSVSLSIMLARIAAMVMFVFSYVAFVTDHGYMEQIHVIGQGLVQWSQAFTFGTLSNYFNGFACTAWTIVLGLSFFAIHIVYIIKEPGIKRVLMILLMLIVLAALVLYLLFIWGALGTLQTPVVGFESLWQNIKGQGLQGFALPIYLAALAFTLFAASGLAVKSTLRNQMKQWLSSVISVYLGLPLLLWFTQNLLALAAMIIFLVLVGGILYLLFSVLVSRVGDPDTKKSSEPDRGSVDDSGRGGRGSYAGGRGSYADGRGGHAGGRGGRAGGRGGHADGDKATVSGAHTPQPGQRIVEVEPGARLWKIKSATGDYIQSVTGGGATGEVCAAAEFDKGKVIIMQAGEQISMVPWKPK